MSQIPAAYTNMPQISVAHTSMTHVSSFDLSISMQRVGEYFIFLLENHVFHGLLQMVMLTCD